MKKILTLFGLTLVSAALLANPVGRDEARNVAARLLSALGNASVNPQQVLLPAAAKKRGVWMDASQSPAFYIFEGDDSQGFVIVSGDDAFPSVVAYSPDAELTVGGEMPEALTDFLDTYARYVDEVRAGRAQAPVRKEKGDITGDVVIGPLLTSTWNQDAPYNGYCPNSYPVGCVATAMSQIMYFWKYPSSGKGYINYEYGGGYLAVDFTQSNYDWSTIKDSYSPVEWKKATGKNVAKLCYDCGVACYMNYNEGGSGATIIDAYNAMFTTFGYNAQSTTVFLRKCMDTDDQWNGVLYGELNARRPVLYAGVSSSGGGSDAGGHAFVIDGYDSNRFVHVNWGWGGSYNGYYDLKLLDPARYTFSDNQQMVVGIKPDKDEKYTQRKQFPMLMVDSLKRVSTKPVELGTDFVIKIGGIYNYATYSGNYTIAIMLYDKDGNFVQKASRDDSRLNFSLGVNYGYSEFGNVSCNVSKSVKDGDYFFRVMTQENGFTDFTKPFTYGGHSANKLKAYIHDGNIYFNQTSPGFVENTSFDDPDYVCEVEGDVNGDGVADISDIVAIINLIAAAGNDPAADVNGDNTIDISDIVAVINIIAGN